MRLIDAEELLEHLEDCLQNGRPLSNSYDLNEIVHYVKSMPTASPWHRVEEELPKYGDWVLCLGPKGGYYVSEFRGVSCLVGPRFHANGRFINATHWMPLPEPPKEDNDG